MKTIKPLSQSLLHKVFEDAQGCHLSVGILGFFPFDASSGLLSEIDLWKFVPGELGEDLLDMCMPKPRGEALVVGKCFAPEGEPVQMMTASLRIGSIDKTLSVIGDRRWKRRRLFRKMTEPVPFTEMPITWENAYGGAKYKRNPLGKGYATVRTDAGEKIHPLPNIESPDNRVVVPWERVEPAGFGPLDQMWPQRMEKAGTYNKKWQKERFPGLPDDMDRTFFNAAPEDQYIDGFFRGDEPFEIENMHPEKPLVQGKLPGIKPRCFINRKSGESERFEEVETRLDTVWLFPHAEKGVLIHRAVADIETDDADDVLHILLAYERMGDEPRTLEHYRKAFLDRTDEEKGHLHAMDEKPLIPPGETSAFASLMEEAETKEESALSRNLARRAEREKEKAKEQLRGMGLDPEQFIPEKPPETPELRLDNLGEIEAFAEKTKADALAKKAEMEEQLRKSLAAEGMDYDQLLEQAQKTAGGPPKFSAKESIEQLRAAGMSDPAMEKNLEQAEEAMQGAYRRFAHHFPPAPPPAADKAASMRAAVVTGHAEGRSFAGQDLTGADLSGLELRGIDLKDALLEGANLKGADLSGADLSHSVLARADLSGARLRGAKMAEACIGAAKLEGAQLAGADLSQATFGKAELGGADLSKTKLEGADFMEAKMAQADLSKAALKETTFLENDLSGARFVEADASQCMFINANIEAADFTGARLVSAVFVGVKAENAVFKGADLTKACAASEAKFAGADFSGANLTQAGMRGNDFSGARFEGARMEMADLGECQLKEARLRGAFARQARFDKSDLEGADMASINLYEGSLMKAKLASANLRGANLYSAECMRADLEGTDLTGANLEKTKIAEKATG